MKRSFGFTLLKIYAFVLVPALLLFTVGSLPQNTAVAGLLFAVYLASSVLALIATFGIAFQKAMGPRLLWIISSPLYFFIWVIYLVFGIATSDANATAAIAWYDWVIGGVLGLFVVGSFVTANVYPYIPAWRKGSAHSKPNTPQAPSASEASTGPYNQNIRLQPARDPLLIPFFKLALMSIITLGVYDIYWFYRLWQYEQKGTETKGGLIIRAVFSGVTSFWLFKRLGLKDWLILAVLYLVIPYAAYLPEPYELLWILSVIPLIYGQQQINERFKQSNRGFGSYSTLEKWVVGVTVPLWIILIALIMIGTYYPA